MSPAPSAARQAVARVIDEALEATVVLSFSRLGYLWRRDLFGWNAPQGPPAPDRTAVVTGGSTGIGRAVAAGMARTGRRVVIVSRDPGAGARAAAAIGEETGNPQVSHHPVDLSSMAATRAFASALSPASPVDVLVHNAGALFRDHRTSVDGIEATVALHVLAPFVLTAALVPALCPSARLVTVTSGGMYAHRLDVGALEASADGYDGVTAYSRAKRAQVALTREWARRLGPAGIAAHVMHPGWVDTPGLTTGLPGFARIARPLLRSAEQGADTAVWLAAAAVPPPAGRLWLDRRPRRETKLPFTSDPPGEVDRLWAWCTDRAGGADHLPDALR